MLSQVNLLSMSGTDCALASEKYVESTEVMSIDFIVINFVRREGKGRTSVRRCEEEEEEGDEDSAPTSSSNAFLKPRHPKTRAVVTSVVLF